MYGKLYGVGVGPGSADYLTVKAVNCIREADIICIPTVSKDLCRAYRIAKEAVPETEGKECICLDCKMTRSREELEKVHSESFEMIRRYLSDGKNVAFITIGDPVVYSTFTGIMKKASDAGFEAEQINGITSFTASAAALGISLCEEEEEIHIGTGQSDIEGLLKLPGTKIIMKAGKNIGKIKETLRRAEETGRIRVYAVINCGTEEESRYFGAEDIPVDAGYMTTIIIKELKQQ